MTKRDVDTHLFQTLGPEVGLNENYLTLMRKLTDSENEFFAALETFNGVSMSKRLFVPTDIYGTNRYRRRPNIRVREINIWTGVNHHNLLVLASPQVDAFLQKCTLRHSVYFQTDEYGFKLSNLKTDANAPAIFFLGDSYTEGSHTEAKNTFVNLAGQRFQDNGYEVNAINL